MIIIMKMQATDTETDAVITRVTKEGFKTHVSVGEERTIIGIIGDERLLDRGAISRMKGVDRVVPVLRPYKLASRDFKPENTVITINGHQVGGDKVIVMAGPCSVESLDQMMETAIAVREAGAHLLRGGAFKPRTSPYSFQGMGEEGLKIMAQVREETGLHIVTEVMAPEQVDLVAKYADVLQIGTRNMQNYALLNAVGKTNKPVLLKRGMMSTIEELLMSAEYIMSNGNHQVMLCERGIRTFEKYTRNTLDINAVPVLKELTHLPVVVDPSHATGRWTLVKATSKAAVAAGADGLIIEVHPNPAEAASDGEQSLKPHRFAELMNEIRPIAAAVDRSV
ncbi:MAG TPA: 3-deoxy-7-phosphoheptulonate synthase [Anaerolineae bacterium]|nr:3-deoxy-7-phosphoheptulonate synthase [Anaerolineae bacterium]MCB0178251.1 3-deoxy-7-phosphoheptulonate synthase [Anaerolineae bacterium]MCB0224857.1 3-deoxy-7-phosphoheptulonate synthase [Anaerolineae bacterium]MCB9106580.1 3-deoxy-7-phosphoheptulonate synthase [Anaerolineales bacterium]HRV92956.1 3-deoxy-7-phosphoheptulonate synthase [Anaerolineae bacterium]